MPKAKSDEIRKFVIDSVNNHPRDIARITAERFGITRQAVNRHFKTLIEDEILEAKGKTKERSYSLVETTSDKRFLLKHDNQEDVVWREFAQPVLEWLPETVLNICCYGFTEMYNNAVEHSDGTSVLVSIIRTAKSVRMMISDDGIGIFEKIKSRFGLDDHRQAILELCKGKLTTDAEHHTGQGVFFSSRMFDKFSIHSGRLYFAHLESDNDWLIKVEKKESSGTTVFMTISPDTNRTTKAVFDKYADLLSDDYAFSKTHVPLTLAQYDNEQLISRSQAKRVLARFDRFKEVFLDFHGVDSIGQAFADEIFRVYRRTNPEVKIVATNTSDYVRHMIKLAESESNTPSTFSTEKGPGFENSF